MSPRLNTFWWLLRRSLVSVYENSGLGIAKGAAYSALLSFFPLMASIGTVLVLANAQRVAGTISRFLFQVVPPGTEELLRYQLFARGARPILLPVSAILLSIWAASGLMATLMEGFRAAYHIPSGRPVVRERGVAILLVFAAVVPVIVASSFIVAGSRMEQLVGRWVGLTPAGAELEGGVQFAGGVLRYIVTFLTTVLVTMFLYYLGPNRKQQWRYVWPGAVLATVLWFISTMVFGWYVRNIANYNVMYGSIGAVIALLIWMYVLSILTLLGCEFNANWEHLSEMDNAGRAGERAIA